MDAQVSYKRRAEERATQRPASARRCAAGGDEFSGFFVESWDNVVDGRHTFVVILSPHCSGALYV
jgi:hypothetical protein